MAKRRKRGPRAPGSGLRPEAEPKPAAPASSTSQPAPVSGRSPEPEARSPFWFDLDLTWAKLSAARVIIFGLLALDALMQIRHAPRYGAGGFNVAQLAFLDSLGPTRRSYELCELVNAYLLVAIACGVGTRIALPLVAAIYSWLYFGSQLDSYQHHYLVALLLWIACFVPWQRPAEARADTRVRSWAVRLMLVQIAIMYLWAAISKMSPAWLDGSALAQQIRDPMRGMIESTIGFSATAWLVVPTELALAALVWNRVTWPIAAPLGLLFHLGIVLSGLEIGLFAWLMIGLYSLVLPDRVWLLAARYLVAPIARRVPASWRSWPRERGRWIVWGLAFAVSIVLAALCRFDHALAVGIVLAIVLLGRTAVTVVRGRPHVAWLAVAHLLAFGTWFAVDRASTVAPDYYLFWAGSARRLGDTESAMVAYARLVAIAPDSETGHFYYGRLLLAHDRTDEGLAELHEAERADPKRARAFVAEARWLASHGKRDEAVAKAREARRAEPFDDDVRKLNEALGP